MIATATTTLCYLWVCKANSFICYASKGSQGKDNLMSMSCPVLKLFFLQNSLLVQIPLSKLAIATATTILVYLWVCKTNSCICVMPVKARTTSCCCPAQHFKWYRRRLGHFKNSLAVTITAVTLFATHHLGASGCGWT